MDGALAKKRLGQWRDVTTNILSQPVIAGSGLRGRMPLSILQQPENAFR
jgi:hypothetical protein